jgi:purine-binding chemotaxis protein CheW
MKMQGGKFLSFILGTEVYGIPIKESKEIIGMMEITHIPKMQNYIKGVINLRGKIIPVVDLRLRLGMEERDYDQRTCIIVVEVKTQGNQRLMGMVVDSVADVVTIPAGDIEPPPEICTQVEGAFLTGLGKTKERVIMLLEIDMVLNREELDKIKTDGSVK